MRYDDIDALGHDPALKMTCERAPDAALWLASQLTLSRLENLAGWRSLARLAHSIRRDLIDGGIDRAAASGEPVQVADSVIERVLDLGVVHVAKAMWDKLGIREAIQKRSKSVLL